jgi:hypothetical protein
MRGEYALDLSTGLNCHITVSPRRQVLSRLGKQALGFGQISGHTQALGVHTP